MSNFFNEENLHCSNPYEDDMPDCEGMIEGCKHEIVEVMPDVFECVHCHGRIYI